MPRLWEVEVKTIGENQGWFEKPSWNRLLEEYSDSVKFRSKRDTCYGGEAVSMIGGWGKTRSCWVDMRV